MDFTQEQLEQLKKTLPADIVEAITTFKFGFTVEEICGKQNLLISETDEAYKLVLKVVTGTANPSSFEDNLRKALPDQDEETIKAIVADIDKEIFQELKHHLVAAVEKKEPTDGVVGHEHREAILAAIEDDPHLLPVVQPAVKPIEEKKTNILEQKLANTVQTTPKSTTVNIIPAAPASKLPPTPPPAPQKQYNNDPYREPII